jgi:hypothetical protein
LASDYRQERGTWPPNVQELARFAAENEVPINTAAFESLTLEPNDARDGEDSPSIAFAVLAWLLPFAASVCIFPLKRSHSPLFESVMGVVLAASTVLLG